jgi:hypothetical protein
VRQVVVDYSDILICLAFILFNFPWLCSFFRLALILMLESQELCKRSVSIVVRSLGRRKLKGTRRRCEGNLKINAKTTRRQYGSIAKAMRRQCEGIAKTMRKHCECEGNAKAMRRQCEKEKSRPNRKPCESESKGDVNARRQKLVRSKALQMCKYCKIKINAKMEPITHGKANSLKNVVEAKAMRK